MRISDWSSDVCSSDLLALSHDRCAMLFHIVKELFPKGGDLTVVKFWTGLRPMIPDGGPLIGPTRLANLYLNTGHGTLGWTLGPGPGRLLADLLSGRQPRTEEHTTELQSLLRISYAV